MLCVTSKPSKPLKRLGHRVCKCRCSCVSVHGGLACKYLAALSWHEERRTVECHHAFDGNLLWFKKGQGVSCPRQGTLSLYCGYKVLVARVAQVGITLSKPLNSFIRAAKQLLILVLSYSHRSSYCMDQSLHASPDWITEFRSGSLVDV